MPTDKEIAKYFSSMTGKCDYLQPAKDLLWQHVLRAVNDGLVIARNQIEIGAGAHPFIEHFADMPRYRNTRLITIDPIYTPDEVKEFKRRGIDAIPSTLADIPALIDPRSRYGFTFVSVINYLDRESVEALLRAPNAFQVFIYNKISADSNLRHDRAFRSNEEIQALLEAHFEKACLVNTGEELYAVYSR